MADPKVLARHTSPLNKRVMGGSIHSQWTFFPFHRNCTSQSYGTVGNHKIGGFVNRAVNHNFILEIIAIRL